MHNVEAAGDRFDRGMPRCHNKLSTRTGMRQSRTGAGSDANPGAGRSFHELVVRHFAEVRGCIGRTNRDVFADARASQSGPVVDEFALNRYDSLGF